jgi:hypothetical protein
MSLPPTLTGQPPRGPNLFAPGKPAPKPAVPSAAKPDPLAAIRAKIKSGEIKAPAAPKARGLFADTAASATLRLTRLERVVKLLASKLPSTELDQVTADVGKLT